MYKVIGGVLLLGVINIANAGTEIVIQHDSQTSTVLAEGNQVRLNTGPDEYVLIDSSRKLVNTVKPGEQRIVTMDIDSMPKSRPININTDLRMQGVGPGIAGYATMQFRYTVNGKDCGVIYGSKDAFMNSDIQTLYDAMKTMVDSQRALMGGFIAMMDDCKLGDMTMIDHANTIGMPMRTERGGVVTSQVKSVRTGVQFPAGTFDLPEGFARVSVQQEMQSARADVSNVEERTQQTPHIQQQMQQAQRPYYPRY